ncbi:hypothetical protein FACS1894211_15880 [Clostridia bacterium]|nr:hypothetical protein FACS1894211_15880 [Clostridia bacterium]
MDKETAEPQNVILTYSPAEIVALANAVAFALAEGQNAAAVNSWGNLLTAAGAILTAIAGQMSAGQN